MKVDIDESVTPAAQRHLCVPFHLCDKVGNELKRLFDARIIDQVTIQASGHFQQLQYQKEIQMKLLI